MAFESNLDNEILLFIPLCSNVLSLIILDSVLKFLSENDQNEMISAINESTRVLIKRTFKIRSWLKSWHINSRIKILSI